MAIHTRIFRTLTAVAVATALALSGATPASSAVVDADRVLIDTAHADFGMNHAQHVWGRPSQPARVDWGNNAGGNDWLSIQGRLTLDAFWGGGCARVQADLRDDDRRTLRSESTSVCGGGFGPAPHTFLSVHSTDTRVESVRICTTFNGAERRCATRYRNA